jgi:2-oxoacid dehydrogenase-like protein with E3 subunit-binding domain
MMAQQAKKQQRRSRTNSRGNSSGGGRPAVEAMRADSDADREYRAYARREEQDRVGPPDVLVDVPELKLDLLHFELDDLDAHVALKARVLNLIKLNIGVDVQLSRVKLDIKGVHAEVVLKARLDHVTAIVDRLMTTLDRNPELVDGLSKAVSEVGQGAGQAVDSTGDAAKELGAGAQSALQNVGSGAGQAVGDVGQGAGQAVGDVGQGAGQAVGNLDQVVGGAGQTLGQTGQAAGQALGGVGEAAGGAGQAAGQAGQAAGQAGGQAGQAGGHGGDSGGEPNGATPAAGGTGGVAKEVAKTVARELGHAASDEARELSMAATRKVRELGERREQRRAEKHHATEAAIRLADELGIDLTRVRGTGSEGRITVNDVREAQEA